VHRPVHVRQSGSLQEPWALLDWRTGSVSAVGTWTFHLPGHTLYLLLDMGVRRFTSELGTDLDMNT
jgi:hypothetical protein